MSMSMIWSDVSMSIDDLPEYSEVFDDAMDESANNNDLSGYPYKFVSVCEFNSSQYLRQNNTIEGSSICASMATMEMLFNQVEVVSQRLVQSLDIYDVLFASCPDMIRCLLNHSKFKPILNQLIVLGIATSNGAMSSVDWLDMFCGVISDASNGEIIIRRVIESPSKYETRTIQYNAGFMLLNSNEDVLRILKAVIEKLMKLYETSQQVVQLLDIALNMW